MSEPKKDEVKIQPVPEGQKPAPAPKASKSKYDVKVAEVFAARDKLIELASEIIPGEQKILLNVCVHSLSDVSQTIVNNIRK